VIEGAYRIIDDTRSIAESVDEMRHVTLAPAEQEAFVEAALQLRYEKDKAPDVSPREVIAPRRSDDVGNDLWRTFNRTQENLILGCMRYLRINEADVRPRRETHPVNSIDGSKSRNRALWTLATRMAELAVRRRGLAP
jgi:uncharacterized protein DUF932